MGPVITPESRTRIERSIARGAGEGAAVIVDGELLVRDGLYLRGHEREIARRAAAAVAKVWERAEVEGTLARERSSGGRCG